MTFSSSFCLSSLFYFIRKEKETELRIGNMTFVKWLFTIYDFSVGTFKILNQTVRR